MFSVMGKRNNHIDWEAVEGEYRSGLLSIRQLATKYKCADAAIRRKAKIEGWERDLTARVRALAQSKLVRAEMRTKDPQIEAQVIEDSANLIVTVIHRHRSSIRELDRLRSVLVTKAEVILGKAKTQKDLNDAVSALEGLGRTLARLIPLERQAFSVDEHDGKWDEESLGLAAVLEKARRRGQVEA